MSWLKKNFWRVFLSLAALVLIWQALNFWLAPHSDKDQYNQALAFTRKEEAKNLFNQVSQESSDGNLRSKANFNLGALLAGEVFIAGDVSKIPLAQEKLELSLRDDPENFKAKLYLELILRLKDELSPSKNQEQSGGTGGDQPGKPGWGSPQP